MLNVLAQWDRNSPVIWWKFFVPTSVRLQLQNLLLHTPVYGGVIVPPDQPENEFEVGVLRSVHSSLFDILYRRLQSPGETSSRDVTELIPILEEWRARWESLQSRVFHLATPSGTLVLGERPVWMGVLNVTPDSFFDGGRYQNVDQAVRHALELYHEGADILDVGGQSTRPGSKEVSEEEEWRRIAPVLKAIRPLVPIPISVDTYHARVADRAIQAGADLINDVTAGTHDRDMFRVARYHGVPIVLMHFYQRIRPMPRTPHYEQVVLDVARFLTRRIEAAVAAGVDAKQIVIDPGIGFGKTPEHNLELIRHLGFLKSIGRPILFGPSRKSFMARAHVGGPEARLEGTITACAWAWMAGAHIFRVHDIWPVRKGLAVWTAIAQARYAEDMPWRQRE